MNAVEMLDQLAEVRAQSLLIESDKQRMIDSILTPEIRQQIADIEAEFAPKAQAAAEKSSELESTIKAEVLAGGQTAQGDSLECTFAKGRISWDTKGLDEAIKVLPQLAQYKKQGEPYATIRARK